MRTAAKRSTIAVNRGSSSRFVVGLLAAVLITLAMAPNATAVLTRAKTASFGPDGTASTSFVGSGSSPTPGALAFDQASDKLYVGNTSNQTPLDDRRLHAFDVSILGSYTPLSGNFPLIVTAAELTAIGVDNTALTSAGNIYYASSNFDSSTNTSTRLIHGFRSDGTPLGGNFPIDLPSSHLGGAAVDSAGNIWVGDFSTSSILKFDSLGNPIGSISTSAQGTLYYSLAFDSNDDMFIGSPAGGSSQGVWKFPAPSYTSATRVDPTISWAIAVDATANRLYVLNRNKISVYDTGGSFLYDFAGGIPNANFEGIAVDEETDTVYLSDGGSKKVYAYSAAQDYADATVRLTPARSITDTTAEIGASIADGNAATTTWRLEISVNDGQTWNPVHSGQTDGGQTNVTISRSLTGLSPNSTYRFRVVTNKGASEATEASSAQSTFRTVAPPPVLTDLGVIEIADTSVRMVGTIDPRNTPTGYVFQYGTTPALGSSTAPVDIGSGLVPITVSQVVDGLIPGTTYYFKLVATNLAGTTASASKTLRTRSTPLPPGGGRAYEQVTPVDKNLGSIDKAGPFPAPRVGVSRDGRAVGFCTSAIFGEPAGQIPVFCSSYISRRGPDGWDTTSPFPRMCKFNIGSGVEDGNPIKVTLSPNFDRAMVTIPESTDCSIPPLDPAAPLTEGRTSMNFYRQDMTVDPFDYDLLAPLGPPNVGIFNGGSDDFGHLVYESYSNQTNPPDSPPSGRFPKVYEWDNGVLRFLAKDTNNVPFATPSALPAQDQGTSITPESAISVQGDRVFFQNVADDFGNGCAARDCELYLRENGTDTIHVSASECTVDCGVNDSLDVFRWASPSGDKALFLSCAKLTNASAPSASCSQAADAAPLKLYRWDRNAPPQNQLVDVSIDRQPADDGVSFEPRSGSHPRVKSVIGASTDGNVVYFVAYGQLIAGDEPGFALRIYRWRWNGGSPLLDRLVTYPSRSGTPTAEEWQDELKRRWVTPDGRYLMVGTRQQFDPIVDRDQDRDIYRWSEADGWLCLSCQMPGAPSVGHATNGDTLRVDDTSINYGSVEMGLHSPEPIVAMSDDGQRVFFDTPDALVPEDVNGEGGCPLLNYPNFIRTCSDVYEWHDGKVSLVSDGTGQFPAHMIAASATGEDIFFLTRNRLVGWDTDNGVDIYNARIGGGFPEPPATGAPCEGEACRGAGTSSPNVPGAATREVAGAGNPRPPAPNGCGRFSSQAQRKLAAAKKTRGKKAQSLRKQARSLNRRAKRCNRRQAS